jgi:hypothetical protein
MHFVVTFGKCRFVKSQETGCMVEGPECGTVRVLVEANDKDSARKSAQRFEHIATYWTEGMTVVKGVELATPEDITSNITPISWYEEHWPQRK